jgi:LuxR family maltose regulon positive regulatory protein
VNEQTNSSGAGSRQGVLLATKLYVPHARPNLVPRPRLVERLNQGLHLRHRLALVSAPAGFGKTTLLSEWLSSQRSLSREYGMSPGDHPVGETPQSQIQDQESGIHVAWLSLDNADNDPARFWSYVIAALQTVSADAGQAALARLQAPQPPPVDAILISLVNELAAISEPFCLVLDDYHLIRTQSIHDSLSWLVDHQPPQMHLVIATRADPPLPLPRLRGRGQMTEIRVDDRDMENSECILCGQCVDGCPQEVIRFTFSGGR